MPDPAIPDATPAERRRLRVRGAILDAAERVFAEEGEAGLSIRRLAEEIDYSPAAIYKYFDSKEALLDELKEAFFERILVCIDETRAGTTPFLERAHACITTYVNTALEKPNHYAAAFSQVGLPDAETCENRPDLPDWQDFMASNKGQAFNYLIEMVEEGQALGVFREGMDPPMAAKSLWAACHGLAMILMHVPRFPQSLAEREGADRESLIDFHADLIVRGLKK